MRRSRIQFVAVLLLGAMAVTRAWSRDRTPEAAHPTANPNEAASVTSVRMVRENGVPAVEVVSTQPMVPTIHSLDSPPRLVIDLPNAQTALKKKRVSVLQDDILTLRMEQYQKHPPVLRIVVDLLVPYGYSWDAAGNRLMVRLKPPAAANTASNQAQPPQVLSATPASTPAFVPVTSGIGEVVLADRRFAAGSSLTAGAETAVLRLSRGGEIRVCPGTTVSVTPSKNSRELMLGMNAGALETHYKLDAAADTVLTPDFHVLFAGPGEFDFAISTDSHGNTCVRGLAGNTSSAIVSELIGDRIYQVKPDQQVVFRSGRIDKVDSNVPLECGCPPPVSVLRTDATPSHVAGETESAAMTLAQGAAPASASMPSDQGQASGSPQVLSNGPETRSLPPSQPNDVHIQVEAPFVFHGKESSTAEPAPAGEAATLPVTQSPDKAVRLEARVQPPPSPPQDEAPTHSVSRRVLGRIKGFLSAIFR